ncbi:MAG: hypothetical protein L6W00_01850 [Lentisphaeria bacterium]|nr:MAG: hypothetical protein L6W00_01850 [Lentisphaeria bacterium]
MPAVINSTGNLLRDYLARYLGIPESEPSMKGVMFCPSYQDVPKENEDTVYLSSYQVTWSGAAKVDGFSWDFKPDSSDYHSMRGSKLTKLAPRVILMTNKPPEYVSWKKGILAPDPVTDTQIRSMDALTNFFHPQPEGAVSLSHGSGGVASLADFHEMDQFKRRLRMVVRSRLVSGGIVTERRERIS